MHTAVTPTAQPATATQPATILVSLELSQTDWVLAVQPPDAPKMSRHTMKAGDTERLLSVLQTHRTRTERRRGGTVGFVSIQEAGLDGFWLHRWLEANGIESHVVDAASIAAPRRKQRAKTDGIDGETLVRTLAARRTTGLFDGGAADARGRGSPPPLTRARPTDARADRAEQSHRRAARRPGGARLPAMQKTRWTALEALRRPGGGELPAHLMAELRRLLQRLELLLQQLKAVEVERDAMVLAAAAEAGSTAALLLRLRGLGPQFTAVLWLECFYRHFANRRQLAAYGGLAPTPWRSGSIKREQGISAAGNPRLRKTTVELAWTWLQWQPDAALSRWWFLQRVKGASARTKRILIVALARKLLVALWRYVIDGVVPEGAVLKAA